MTTTQNCADCGTRAEPGQSFCDACGAVLSWTDRANARASTGASGASAASSAPEGASGGASGAPAGDGAADSDGSGPDDSAPASRPAPAAADSRAASGSSASPDASASPDVSASAPGEGPGWDAFARSDGGVGLARTQRDLLGARTATAEPGTATAAPAAPTDAEADADPGADAETAPVRTDAGNTPSWARSHTAAPDAPPVARDDRAAGAHPDTLSAAAGPAVDETADTEPLRPADPRPARLPGDGDDMADRARRLLVPVDDPEPRPAAAPSVAPVLPGRPAAARPQVVRAPGEELGADGGMPCPWCSTRNRPERHFCARCAMPMAGHGPTPGRLPWWRRLGFRSREVPWAGDRPRLRRTFDRVLSWVAGAVVLTLLIVLAFNIPKGVQATRDHFAKRAWVAPDSVSASRSYPGHKPDLAFDQVSNTWWGPGVSESGKGQWIEARFDEPTRLLDLIITPGVSSRADQNSKAALPHRLQAVITTDKGKTLTRKIVLDQGAGGQLRAFRVGAVTKVRFVIESAHRASPSKQVSIAEIEFFGPSSANSS